MSDINRVILIGNLTRDAELSYTTGGYAMTKFSIAVNRRKKQVDQWVDEANFFNAVVWGKRGESLKQYLIRGQKVAIEGELRQERWEKDGQKHSMVSIDVSNIQLLGGKQETPGRQPKPFDGDPSGGGFKDDIPF